MTIELPAEKPCKHAIVITIEPGHPYGQQGGEAVPELYGITADWWIVLFEEID